MTSNDDQPVVYVVPLSGPEALDLQEGFAPAPRDMPLIFVTGCRDASMALRAVLQAEKELRSLREAHDALTPRERQVMAMVAAGLLNKQVAWELGIAEITVKLHRGNVMRKMKARSFADLVRMAAALPGE